MKVAEVKPERVETKASTPAPPLDIAPDDPLLPYLLSASGTVDIQDLDLDSPALRSMKEVGIELVVPLVSQGELIGALNLGPRMSEQQYSSDDRNLLNNLAAQATPALRVAQLVRQQQQEAAERQRIEQELQVARLIQHTLLPKSLPQVEGWHLAAHYQPARAVGGDFYDFIDLEDGRLGLVVGDVTDKGVPAALVMATTRSVLRAAAAVGDRAGRGAQTGQQQALPRHSGEYVRHLPVRGSRPRRRDDWCTPTPVTMLHICGTAMVSRSCALAGCRWG